MDRPPLETLRPLTVQDAQALQTLYEACADFSMRLSGEGVPPDAAWQDLAQTDGVTQWVGWFTADGLQAVVEFRLNHPHVGVCFIGVMQVAPSQRNRGVGSRMMEALKVQWRQAGIHTLRLCVLAASPAAQRFWQRQGFTHHATLPATRFGQRLQVRHELRMPLRC